MKITRENLKNIVREAMVEESAYQEFFKKALEKTGKSIPQMSDDEKKAFFNKIDSAWKGKGEKNEGNAFGAAVADAKKDGDDSFKVGGKEYKVESNEEDLDEEAVVVSKRTPSGNIVSKLKEELESVNEESINEKIKVGSSVTVNYPTLVKPIKGKVAHILKSPTGLVYVLAGGRGVWDAKNVSLKESVDEIEDESVNEGNKPKFKVGDIVKYKGAKVSAKVLKVMPTNWENGYLIQFQDNKKKEEAGESSLVSESVNEASNKPKFKVGQSVNYLPKLSGLNPKKKLKISRVRYDDGDNLTSKGWYYSFNGMNLSAHEKDIKLAESVDERMGSDKGAVGNANFNNRLKAMRDAKNSVVVYIDTNKGKKLLKVFKTQQTAQQFKKKNIDKLLNTKGVESVGTMSKKEWDAKEAKYAIK